MKENNTVAEVRVIPKCDFCDEPALYDSKMKVSSSWAYMCQKHYDRNSCGKLGLGLGQRLVLKEKK